MNAERLCDCGCCGPAESSAAIDNPPALTAISYRLGTYSTFLQRMLQAAAIDPTLQSKWTSREPRDFGFQFLDLWAYLGDILTFYQERIANEIFLGTATQRDSVLRLAALIDYRPGPGSAALVHLAFVLDAGKTLTIPAELKAQSVPGPDEKPQKFETVESQVADSRWNRLRVWPRPQPVNPLSRGSQKGTVVNDPVRAKPLAAGTPLVIFDQTRAETKQIASVSRTERGLALQWNAPLRGTFNKPAAAPLGRQFRLFGYNAPTQFMAPTAEGSAPGGIRWTLRPTCFAFSAAAVEFPLESTVEGLTPGAEMLLVHAPTDSQVPPFVRRGVIVSAETKPAQRGNLQSSVTHVRLEFETPLPPGVKLLDLRQLSLLELSGAAIQFSHHEFPKTIPPGDRVFVPLSTLQNFPRLRAVMFDDEQGSPHLATVTASGPSVEFPDLFQLVFTPALPREFSTETCSMYGNVVRASHGETVKAEVLGDGDPASRFQQFQLKRSPVTFVPQSGAPNGVANTLEVRVDGVLWKETRTLLGASDQERVYVTRFADDGTMTVQFGGEPGSRVPRGRGNVSGKYRHGLGPDGNVKSGSITTLLDRPAGLKSVSNPLPATGGSAPEPLEMARQNAPNTVRSFGRIISRRDYEDAARELAVVAKARASLRWNGIEQEVLLTVAGEAGEVPGPDLLRVILDDLNARRDRNQRLVVSPHEPVAVLIDGRVQIDAAYLPDNVIAALTARLLRLFDFNNRDLGQPAFRSDVFRACHEVAGVVAVDFDQFRPRDAIGSADAPSDVLIAEPNQILQLAAADLSLRSQFTTL